MALFRKAREGFVLGHPTSLLSEFVWVIVGMVALWIFLLGAGALVGVLAFE